MHGRSPVTLDDYMKNYLSIIYLCLISFLFGCTKIQQDNTHIGRWEADIGEEYMLIWEFDETMLIYQLDEECQTNQYTIDYSKNPIWFDCHIFDTDAYCILKFINENSFMIVGSEDEEPRPQQFEGSEDILTFKRLNK